MDNVDYTNKSHKSTVFKGGVDKIGFFVYSLRTLCLKHINQKRKKEQNHTDFSFAVSLLLVKKCLQHEDKKVEQS